MAMANGTLEAESSRGRRHICIERIDAYRALIRVDPPEALPWWSVTTRGPTSQRALAHRDSRIAERALVPSGHQMPPKMAFEADESDRVRVSRSE